MPVKHRGAAGTTTHTKMELPAFALIKNPPQCLMPRVKESVPALGGSRVWSIRALSLGIGAIFVVNAISSESDYALAPAAVDLMASAAAAGSGRHACPWRSQNSDAHAMALIAEIHGPLGSLALDLPLLDQPKEYPPERGMPPHRRRCHLHCDQRG